MGKTATSFIIPNTVVSIVRGAFQGCGHLTSITIPVSVTSIGFDAFLSCGALTSITFEGTVEEWNAMENGAIWNGVPATEVVCRDGSVTI